MKIMKNIKRRCKTLKFTQIIGCMIAIIGALIIIQVLPVQIWLLILGILFVILGCALINFI